ncbi:MAG: MerR family transcriptional regulator [Candidatus Cryptobacteroides sp.]
MKIGEFSRLMQVTVKTLRHYEKKGLLKPALVDEWTGYRYYSIFQVNQLNRIRQMQKLGFSLEEIGELIEDEQESPSVGQLDAKILDTERQMKALAERHSRLLRWRDSLKEGNEVTFSIQSLPEIIVASHRETIPDYDALGPLCFEKIGPAMMALGCSCTLPSYCFTIDHNKTYKTDSIDIEYCEQVDNILPDTSFLKFKRLAPVPKALCLKHIGPYDRFYESFVKAVDYLESMNMRIAGDPRFSYIDGIWNQPDPEKWVSVIQIPVEQVSEAES